MTKFLKLKKAFPILKYIFDLLFKINSLYKFKFILFTATAAFFYSYRISANFVASGTLNYELTTSNSFGTIDVVCLFIFALGLVWFDTWQNKHSKKIFYDIVVNENVPMSLRKDAMSKLKDIQ
jgi:hypothetical protein